MFKNIRILMLFIAGFSLQPTFLSAQIIPQAGTVPVAAEIIPMPSANNSIAKINYVRLWEPWKPITDPALVPLQTVADVKMTTMYADGLGRTIQTVVKQQSPNGKDLVSYKVFDEYGRETIQYLAYPGISTDGYFKTNPFEEQKNFYNTNPSFSGEKVYYSKTVIETSPLGRTLKSMPEGNSWAGNGRGIEKKYEHNGPDDLVKVWTIADAMGSIPVCLTAPYEVAQLYKTTLVNENGKKTVEFTDKEGKLILTKVQVADVPGAAHTGWLCTYNIYDAWNNLRFVIQPKAVEQMDNSGVWVLSNATVIGELCFRYEYDDRNRMIIKKVAGAGEVAMIYDKRDRVVMTQDAKMRTQPVPQWLVTSYDALDREIGTFVHTDSRDRATLQALPVLPQNYTWLTTTVYDNYEYELTKAFETGDISKLSAGANPWAENITPNYFPRGQVTGKFTANIDLSTNATSTTTLNSFQVSTFYYDYQGRKLQTLSDNIVGGVDVVTSRYDFSGKMLANYLRQTNPQSLTNPVTTILTKTAYDGGGRLLSIAKQVNDNGNDKIIVNNSYDELGQLKEKVLAPGYGPDGVEKLNYEYTIRGWLKSVNKDYATGTVNTKKFGYTLGYDNGFTKPQFNGDVSGITWRSTGSGEQRAFGYDYDNARRLLKADFTQNNSGWNQTAGINYNVIIGDGINGSNAYDANGNMKSMQQYGLQVNTSGLIDQLAYYYIINTNKLQRVLDAITTPSTSGDFIDYAGTNDYGYDMNGNALCDRNKNIWGTSGFNQTAPGPIQYNCFNLPTSIKINPMDQIDVQKGKIEYAYDGAGKKLTKKVTEYPLASNGNKSIITTTTYINGLVYESKTTVPATTPSTDYNQVLQIIPHEEGRIRYSQGSPATFQYDYFIKDYLGSVRMVLTDEVQPSSIYKASIETATRDFENKLFFNIPETESSKPTGFDGVLENEKVTKLFGATTLDNRMGPGVVLKVMAGDKFKANAYSWYTPGTVTDVTPPGFIGPMLNSLLGQLVTGVAGFGKANSTVLQNTQVLNMPVETFLNNQQAPSSGVPKAYLNYMVLDEEQFKLVDGNYSAVPILAVTAGQDKRVVQANGGNYIEVKKNGYLFVYVSNESQGKVFFDDLKVEHLAGPLKEETHYYPFGLPMAAISSKAAGSLVNKFKYTGKEEQRQELSDGSGLDWLDYGARMYDAQIGRWLVPDPLTASAPNLSAYRYCANNPVNLTDPDGRWEFGTKKDDKGRDILQLKKSDDKDDLKTFIKESGMKEKQIVKQFFGGDKAAMESFFGGKESSIDVSKLSGKLGKMLQGMEVALNEGNKTLADAPQQDDKKVALNNCFNTSLNLANDGLVDSKKLDTKFEENGLLNPNKFDSQLPMNISSPETGCIIRYADTDANEFATHGATFLLKNAKGTQIFTKNGYINAAPYQICYETDLPANYGKPTSRPSTDYSIRMGTADTSPYYKK